MSSIPATPADTRYQISFDRAAVGLAHIGTDGRFISVNAAYCQVLGYSQDELLERRCRELVHPDDLPTDREQALRLMAGEIDAYTIEKRYLRKDGSTVWIEAQTSIVRTADGAPDFFIVSATDLTKRKEIEAALIRTNDRYRLSTSAAQVGTWDWNLQTNRFAWSASTAAIFGAEPSEAPFAPELATRYAHPEDIERLTRTLRQAIRSGDYECEFRALRPDGTVRWVIGRGKVTYEHGRPVHFYGINIDITELKRTEEALRLREEEFSTLANWMSQLAWMADPMGQVYWYNRRWVEYTGKSLEDMNNGGWNEVIHAEHFERLSAKFAHARQMGEPCEDVFPLLSKAGEQRWFLSRALPIKDDHGHVVRWFGTLTDVTEQLETQRRLAEAVRMRDEFISVASHELRTPLTAIKLQLDALLHVPHERLREFIGSSQRQVDRLAQLVEDMLDVSRLTTGTLRLKKLPTDLRAVVDETIKQLWPQIELEKRRLRVTCDNPVVGEWDASRLEQVVTNLIGNALKYAPGSPIEIALTSEGAKALLSVRDHGDGVPWEMQDRIFERFERGGRADRGGLGLGLYIANEVVRLHGGTLRVESEPGQGANFIVELPLVDASTAV